MAVRQDLCVDRGRRISRYMATTRGQSATIGGGRPSSLLREPSDMSRAAISEALRLIFQGIENLKQEFPNRAFTIDGRLVGDVGEIIAALEYDVRLHDVSQPNHDGTTSDGRNVQIKATFKDSLTFKTVPDYYLGFKLLALISDFAVVP